MASKEITTAAVGLALILAIFVRCDRSDEMKNSPNYVDQSEKLQSEITQLKKLLKEKKEWEEAQAKSLKVSDEKTPPVNQVEKATAANRPPLDYEFFNTKSSGIVFRLTISQGRDFPYDEVVIRVTRVLGSDGSSYGAYYPLSKSELLAGRCLFSSPGGVNPYGSDCKPGDRYIIKVPKYTDPLVIVCPDSAKGLRTDPYSK